MALLLASILAFISYRFKFLTPGGSFAQFILAIIIFGIGGLIWSIPILLFFFSASFFSVIKTARTAINERINKPGTARNQYQVIANGGIAGLLVVLYYFSSDDLFFLLYLSAVSIVCSDTWSTEFGTWKKWPTYNILNFRKMDQGLSGGVSFAGTLAGLAGAIIIALSGFILIRFNLNDFVIIIISGIFGNIIDSILGSSIQVKYKCRVCGFILESGFHCNTTTEYFKGIRLINNDAVNFISVLTGVSLGLLLFLII